MKTLQQILDEYAYLMTGEDWEAWITEDYEIDSYDVREIAQRYADECAKEALRLASEGCRVIKTKLCCGDNYIAYTHLVDKQSILSHDNLPSHE